MSMNVAFFITTENSIGARCGIIHIWKTGSWAVEINYTIKVQPLNRKHPTKIIAIVFRLSEDSEWILILQQKTMTINNQGRCLYIMWYFTLRGWGSFILFKSCLTKGGLASLLSQHLMGSISEGPLCTYFPMYEAIFCKAHAINSQFSWI